VTEYTEWGQSIDNKVNTKAKFKTLVDRELIYQPNFLLLQMNLVESASLSQVELPELAKP
jgi:hypothetical protein